jgi:AbiV family abortive infection protein
MLVYHRFSILSDSTVYFLHLSGLTMKPPTDILRNSIEVTHSNGRQLLEDAKFLIDMDRCSTAFCLAVLAQEEFAKAFLLQLVDEGALPWLPEVQRTMVRHQCKHLLALVMEWLPAMDWEAILEKDKQRQERHRLKMEWFERKKARFASRDFSHHPEDPQPLEPEIVLPQEVSNALNIFRHEEVERFRNTGEPWKDPEWAHGDARKIADGFLDRRKQSGFYVAISKTGQVGMHPGLIRREEASAEIARAERLSEHRDILSDEYRRLSTVLPLVFANLEAEEKDL